ncbi:AAA family ATPase [Nocardioides sp. CN2-186]|uniref:ATP-dependent nuclease n=1 Tax=Nocardioides tweenelious TaxID=3156607 RepID=UPI0032B5FAB0
MPIESVEVRNFRSIRESGQIDLGPITLLIGENNAGKSSLLRAVHMVQGGGRAEPDDIRIGTGRAQVVLAISDPPPTAVSTILRHGRYPLGDGVTLTADKDAYEFGVSLDWPRDSQRAAQVVQIPSRRPDHLTVPFFSRRKSAQYESAVRRDLAQEVDTTDRNLTSRIASLATGAHSEGRRYRELVDRVLGIEVSTYLVDDGQIPGQAVSSGDGIALTRMGEGVSSIVAMMTDLAAPGRRLFLIEEPENDLHPRALRALLDVLGEAAIDGHQFLITTHSDIVLRELGAKLGTRIYRVEVGADDRGLPLSSYHPISDSLDREEALRELGYEQTAPYGWLLMEEASGETFVRDVIIPLFAPRLAILRTVSANGAGNLARRLDGLHSMLLFAHLSTDAPLAWVIADGDRAGRDAIGELRERFSAWPPDRFRTLDRNNIEEFYPARFSDQVEAIRAEGDRQRAMRMKGELVRAVRTWAVGNDDAEAELEQSARPLIDLLRSVQESVAAH